MSITIKFYTVAERKPKYQEDIIYMKPSSSFGFDGFNTMECQVEYVWEGYYEAEPTGNSVCYDPKEDGIKEIGDYADLVDSPSVGGEFYKLELLFDGWIPEDNWLWTPVEEYWKSFEVKGE